MWKSATIGLLGIWLIVATFVLPSGTANLYNSWVVGLIVTNAAVVMSSRRLWERPVATAAGVWLFLCGFMPSMLQGRALVENNLALGAVLIVAAISSRVHLREELAELDRLGILAIDRV